MKKRIIIISSVVAVVLVVGIAVALALFSSKPSAEETTFPSTTASTTEAPPDTSHINKLTGQETLSDKAVDKRPVAIMVNNLKASLPQYGIYGADIMYEVPVEGGITRLMAIFGDYTKIPDVCSVRSCRYYFPIFAAGYDAVYFCFGINESLARPTVNKLGIDWFNGTDKYDSLLFGRDSQRLQKYSREHTAYVKGENIPTALKEYEIRTDFAKGKNSNYFNFKSKNSKAGSIDAQSVRLSFSNTYYSTFEYDKDKKVYYKTHCGNKHMDSAVNKQLNYTNVFVLETDIVLHSDGYLVKVDWTGGTGYYISRGGAQKITWKKSSEDSKIKFYDKDGKQLKVNTGKSYIGVIGKDLTTIKGAEATN